MAKKAETRKKNGPLVRPEIVRALAAAALVVMVLTVVIDALHGHVSHFGVDGVLAAYAVLGLVSGFVIIGLAKGLGMPLSRPDTYYGETDKDADE